MSRCFGGGAETLLRNLIWSNRLGFHNLEAHSGNYKREMKDRVDDDRKSSITYGVET